MPDNSDEKPEGGFILDFFRRNSIEFGVAELFLAGAHDVTGRIAEFVAILRAAREQEGGKLVFRAIQVVIPPFEEEPEAYLERLKAAFPEAVLRTRGTAATPEEVVAAFHNVRCLRTDSLDSSALVRIVHELGSRGATVVTHAALYRAAGVLIRQPDLSVPDDVWAPHLRTVTQALGEAAGVEGYVVIDAGEFNPSRKENVELLLTSKGCVVSADDPNHEDSWIHAAIRRALGVMSGFDLDVKLVSYGTPSRAVLQMAEDFS